MPAANVLQTNLRAENFSPRRDNLKDEIERHVECKPTHVARVLEGNHVIHLRINQNILVLEDFQSNCWS
jgi:hypothetical protein